MPSLLKAIEIRKSLPRRPRDSHKGKNGHVLIVAGSRGMSGAAILSALGALRAGAGLVSVATPDSLQLLVAGYVPEVLTLGLMEDQRGSLHAQAYEKLKQYAEMRHVNAVAVGPGLSTTPGVASIIKAILKWKIPIVLDADGLNNIAIEEIHGSPALIITPHPLELSRLMRVAPDIVKKDRLRIAEETARNHHLICVLKGHHTIITDGQMTRVNPTGNPAMATGGMGDVLTGVIGGLLAQGMGPFQAASAGVYLHGLAADLTRISDRGLLASEVAHGIPRAFQKIGVRS